MARLTTVSDIQDEVLRRAGETTNGNSSFEDLSLDIIDQIHQTIITGGNEFGIDVDETWPWAMAKHPMILQLQPKQTGTATFTKNSEQGTFSSAPSISLEGYHIKPDAEDEWYKIISHQSGQTSFELDSDYNNDSGSKDYKAIKVEYKLSPQHIVITDYDRKIDFEETDGSELTATISKGSYKPSELASEIETQLESQGNSTYTISFDETTQRFTLTSDGAGGGGIFKLLFGTGTNKNKSLAKKIQIPDADQSGSLSYESEQPINAIAKLIEPFHVYKDDNTTESIYRLSSAGMQKTYPMVDVREETPTHFEVIDEDNEGQVTIQFNGYPAELTRVEIPYIPVPRTLQDTTASRPWIPRKDINTLITGATYYLLLDKDDDKSSTYLKLAQSRLLAMMKNHRRNLQKTGRFFGQTIARRGDVMPHRFRNHFRFGEPEDN